MSEAAKELEVGPDGPANRDPLAAWGFRYYPKTRQWRRICSFHERLPPRVSRRTVAEEAKVSEAAIEKWEKVVSAAEMGGGEDSADLLAIGESGPVNAQPLLKCGFCFYPQSRTWRRARASRDEVTRQHVAKRAGVSESAILSWEEAACAALKGRSG